MLKSVGVDILRAIRLTLVFGLIGGIVYPLVVTGISQVVFHDQAGGSLVTDRNGQVVGSRLLGQWNDPYDLRYFHPRPSATIDPSTGQAKPYAAENSAGSNLGPSSSVLIARVQAQVDYIEATEYGIPADGIPVDMVTADFSGLDPHISVANARIQAVRVARVRGLDPAPVEALVDKYTDGRSLLVFGEPGVNVLLLNMALDDGEAG